MVMGPLIFTEREYPIPTPKLGDPYLIYATSGKPQERGYWLSSVYNPANWRKLLDQLNKEVIRPEQNEAWDDAFAHALMDLSGTDPDTIPTVYNVMEWLKSPDTLYGCPDCFEEEKAVPKEAVEQIIGDIQASISYLRDMGLPPGKILDEVPELMRAARRKIKPRIKTLTLPVLQIIKLLEIISTWSRIPKGEQDKVANQLAAITDPEEQMRQLVEVVKQYPAGPAPPTEIIREKSPEHILVEDLNRWIERRIFEEKIDPSAFWLLSSFIDAKKTLEQNQRIIEDQIYAVKVTERPPPPGMDRIKIRRGLPTEEEIMGEEKLPPYTKAIEEIEYEKPEITLVATDGPPKFGPYPIPNMGKYWDIVSANQNKAILEAKGYTIKVEY